MEEKKAQNLELNPNNQDLLIKHIYKRVKKRTFYDNRNMYTISSNNEAKWMRIKATSLKIPSTKHLSWTISSINHGILRYLLSPNYYRLGNAILSLVQDSQSSPEINQFLRGKCVWLRRFHLNDQGK